MNTAQLIFLGVLCLPGLLLVILAVKRRMRPRKRARKDYMLARHAVINKHLPPRGECLLEAMAAILFCACIASVILVCLSDEEDLAQRTGASALRTDTAINHQHATIPLP